ncbi:MAG: TM0996/MTH895 family glutaredoxin-like protein [Methanophagales archaeon]|nr:TM0996/MTH895 family glutaredoxin-like protein [Methanophagales archaeon]
MKIEVLGMGCPKCRATKKVIEGVIKDLRVDAELVEVSDLDEIVDRGVMATPAVFVDGELKCNGWIPTRKEVAGWFLGNGVESNIQEPCSCLYYAMEQAKMIKKEPSLYRLICKGCGIAFSSNVQKDYCFECEKKRRR